MIKLQFLILIFLVNVARSTGSKRVQIQFIGQGYNIFYGNPTDLDIDPGIQNQNLLVFNTTQIQTSGDGKWQYPKSIRFSSYSSCSLQRSSKTFESISEYKRNLDASIGVQGKFSQTSFAASAGYKQISETLKNKKNVIVQSEARCVIQEMGIYETKTFHPLFSEEFLSALRIIKSKDFSQNSFHEFFANYGTHIIVSIKSGSKFGHLYSIDNDFVKKLDTQGFSAETQISLIFIKLSFKMDKINDVIKEFQNSINLQQSYSTGADMVGEGNLRLWASQQIEQPQPISLQIMSFDIALNVFTQQQNYNFQSEEIVQFQHGFSSYFHTYCQEIFKNKDDAKNCSQDKLYVDIEQISREKIPFYIQNPKNGKSVLPKRESKNDLPETFTFEVFNGDVGFAFILQKVWNSNKIYYQIKHIESGQCFYLASWIIQYFQMKPCNKEDKDQLLYFKQSPNIFSKIKSVKIYGYEIFTSQDETQSNSKDCFLCKYFQFFEMY